LNTSPESIDETAVSASGKKRIVLLTAFIFIVVLVACWFWKRPISGVGGFPMPGELVVEVPQFFQGDPRWDGDRLGATPGTLGGEGCAIASASMVLGFYGMDVDPKRLNQYLSDHQGYEGEGWLRWESAADYTPGVVEKAYEDLPSYGLIDWNLLRGNPVIVRIRRLDDITHFVVIIGKRGFDYLIRDPAGWGNPVNGGKITPFARLGVPAEALRYYRRLD
jgi:hypothetical protein